MKLQCSCYLLVFGITLQILEGENTKLLSQSEPQPSKITSISFNSDGHQVAIGLDDGTVKVKNLSIYSTVYSHLKLQTKHSLANVMTGSCELK